MKNWHKGIITACIVLFLLNAVYLAFLRWIFGPGQTLGAFYFLLPLEVSALIAIAALCWFVWLGMCFFRNRRYPPAIKISTQKRAAIIAVSLLVGPLGIFYGLLFHHGCVSLMQCVETDRAIGTYSQIQKIELACQVLLSDAGIKDFLSFFRDPTAPEQKQSPLKVDWNTVMPDLLLHGRNAQAPVLPEVLRKLGPNYLDISVDKWGRPFVFSDPALTKKIVAVRSLGTDGVPSSDDILQDANLGSTEDEIYDPAVLNRTPYGRIYALFTGEKLVPE